MTTPIASPSTPNAGHEEDRPADDPEVVDDRRDRRGAEVATGVERAGRDGAGGEEQRGEDHDPGELGGQGELGRVEARA